MPTTNVTRPITNYDNHTRSYKHKIIKSTRNSAIADKPRDALRGQSRSPNMVPFHVLDMVFY